MPEQQFTLFWHGPFSQWEASPFQVGGLSFTHAEQFMMHAKAVLFGDRVRAAGGVPILATIPFSSDSQHQYIPEFNRVVSELRAANALPAGPDLYTWFATHSDELRDGVHPNERGIVSTNRLWSEAVDALYR